MEIEEVFSSKLRMKIVRLLVNAGELNVSEIARKLGVNFHSVSEHLRILESEGIVLHKLFGRIRLYRLNEVSQKTRAVRNLVEVWEKSKNLNPI